MKNFLLICLSFLSTVSFATEDTTAVRTKVYGVNKKLEIPIPAALIVASYFGFRELDRISTLTEAEVNQLNPANINGFDRSVVNTSYAGFANAQKHSDLFLNISIVSPILLMIDKNMRRDWLDLLSMYAVTHAVDNAVYFAAAFSIRRARPLSYNPEVPMFERAGDAKSNSFFSGHVSFSATSTFFAAKVFTDYHQIKSWKRLLVYTAAAVPPGLVGYYRMKAGKHFRTDVILGLLVGASSGILVPELHRKGKKENKLSLEPYISPQGYNGLTLNYKL